MRTRKNKKTFVQTTLGMALISAVVGGLSGSGTSYIFPKAFDKQEYNLRATVCSPSEISAKLVNVDTGEEISVEGGFPTPIFVSFENTGKNPLTDIDLYIEFATEKKDFLLQEESYGTKPSKGFGKVDIEKPNDLVRIIKIPLFNPGERIIYRAFGNYPVKTTTYFKKPGLTFYSEVSPNCNF